MGLLSTLFGRDRVAPASLPLEVLAGGAWVDAVGESYRMADLAALVRGEGHVRQRCLATLRPEPDNPRDPTAVAVYIEGRHVAYISAADLPAIRPLVDLCIARGNVAACAAEIVGGRPDASGMRIFGVRLDIRNEAAERAEGIAIAPPTLAGKTVCFTGAGVCRIGGRTVDRATQERLATRAGLVVVPRVTQDLDLLVLADVNSASGKARLANKYSTARMSECDFWTALGLSVD